jgi:NitT/TauT family transport system substrate-binding protein
MSGFGAKRKSCARPEHCRAEGFTDIRYVATVAGIPAAQALARGEFDFTTNYAPPLAISIDAGEPITILGGEHIG